MTEIPRIIYVSAAANSLNPHAFKILQHVLGECKCNRVELRFGGGDLSDLTLLVNAVTPKSKLIAIMRSGELSEPVSILALNITKLYWADGVEPIWTNVLYICDMNTIYII